MTVQNFVKIVWTVFEKFEIFMKRSGEKKQHDCISSRKFFPTPKNSRVVDGYRGDLAEFGKKRNTDDFLRPLYVGGK